MYYRKCGNLPIHPFRPNENMAPLGKQRPDGSRESGGPWMSMLMLTEGDARYAAAHLTMLDDGFVYVAAPNFLGYEGPDYGVRRHLKSVWSHGPGRYHSSVSRNHLAHVCWDRTIVQQADAYNYREV